MLVSNEYVAARADILKSNLERMGVPNAVVLNEAPARIADALPEFFDRVLVDAPCSGEGMFRKEPVARQQHCEALVKQCAELGAEILDCAAAVLAPGGSWCIPPAPLHPRRTRDRWRHSCSATRSSPLRMPWEMWTTPLAVRAKQPHRRPAAGCEQGAPYLALSGRRGPLYGPARQSWHSARSARRGEYTAEEQLWLAAAEAAAKRPRGRAASLPRPGCRSARRENARACREAVQGEKRSREAQAGETSPAQSLAAWHAFAGQYFPALVDRPAVVHGGGVLLPVPFPQTNLHVLRAGVFVGSVQKGRFVPEHHLFTAFGAQCVNREELTLDDPRCVEYLSGREVEARIAADGWCCVTVDGWPLGGGKVSGGRVKNHYPKALRLL